MKLATVLSLAFFLTADATKAHPVASVIALLDRLQDQVEAEGEAELKTYNAYKKWCDASVPGWMLQAINDDAAQIDTDTLIISAKTKQAAQLNIAKVDLQAEIDKYGAEDLEADTMRGTAVGNYEAADKDFTATIKAVGDAVTALKASANAASLLQLPKHSRQKMAMTQLMQKPLVLELLSDMDRDALSAIAFGPGDADILKKEKYAKSGATYTFKSNTVIGLLEKLKTEISDKSVRATKAETTAANEHTVAKAARTNAIAAAKKTLGAKSATLTATVKDNNAAKLDKKVEEGELTVDTKERKDTAMACKLKAADFAARTKTRSHEMAAMRAAEEVLAKVSGVRTEKANTKDLPSLPGAKPASGALLQVEDPKMKVVSMLKQKATEEHSKELSRFADQIARKLKLGGPFNVINGMVQKMIFRLQGEQTKEDEHKHWCDLEISNSLASQSDKKTKMGSLTAQINDGKAVSSALGLKIQTLNGKVTALDKYMAEAIEVRREGKEENKLAIKDAEAAQSAIAKAQAVLSQFYKASGATKKEDWEFLQVKALPKEPATWASESYTSTANPEEAGKGVLAVLMATAEDFAKMQADSMSQETTDQQQFDTDMKDAKINKAKSAKEAEMKIDEKHRTDDNVKSMENKNKDVSSEHGAVTQYLTDLNGSCVDGDSSYADRKKARDDETEALRSAQTALQNAFKEPEEKAVEKDGGFLQIRRHA